MARAHLFSVELGGECFDFVRVANTSDTYLPAIAAFAKSCHRFPLSGTNEGQKWQIFKKRLENYFRPTD
jgi:hypothetical protein